MHIYKVWQERIRSGVFTKAQCNQFATAIARQALDLSPHGKRTNIDRDMAVVLAADLQLRGGVRLTDEHTEQGLAWIARNARRSMPDFPVEEVLAHFSHFRFMGEILTYGTYGNGTLPVWRICLTDGRMLDYHNAAWQGGDRTANGWRWVSEGDVLARSSALTSGVVQ